MKQRGQGGSQLAPQAPLVKGLLLILFALTAACSKQASRPPNFVVIDIDSFLASRLGATRRGEPVTPHIDVLASRGARFDAAFSQSGWTLPALTSLFSGSHPLPPEHRRGGLAWREDNAPDLATIFRWYGYTTISFWRNTLLGTMRGPLVRGFSVVWPQKGAPLGLPLEAPIRWLEGSPTEPFLLFVQDLDLHDPSAYPVPEYARPWTPPSGAPPPHQWIDAFTEGMTAGEADGLVDRLVARYDGNLHLYDARIGLLMATLEREDLADHTVVVLLSNHGEDMFVHAYGDHGQLYDTVLRIPLVINDPAMPETGRVIHEVVQLVDIAPTLLARAGIVADHRMSGHSLLPLLGLAEGGYTERAVLSLTDGCNAALRADEWKLLIRDDDPRVDWAPVQDIGGIGQPDPVELARFLEHHGIDREALPDCDVDHELLSKDKKGDLKMPPATGGIKPSALRTGLFVELFDLASDPRESRNLALERADRAIPMANALLDWLEARRQAATGASHETMTPEQLRALQEQGYWGFVQPAKEQTGQKPAGNE